MLLLDVAPLSLGNLFAYLCIVGESDRTTALQRAGRGIEMAGGMMQKLIERNSTIPTNKSQANTVQQLVI